MNTRAETAYFDLKNAIRDKVAEPLILDMKNGHAFAIFSEPELVTKVIEVFNEVYFFYIIDLNSDLKIIYS